jgi:hypothetical protein
MNKDARTWTVRAFLLTLLVLLVATLVAQGDGPQAVGTSPAGAEDGGRRSNWAALVPAEVTIPDASRAEAELAAAHYVSPLIVSAADFSNDGMDPDGFFFDFAGGYVNGDGTACLKAPVYLPNGASVVSVYASLYDNAVGLIIVNLWRVNVASGVSDMMANFGTLSDSTAIQLVGDEAIDYPDVSYPTYAYYLTTCLNYADHRLYSVRIYYTGP